ncbi:MAG TPA: hypothetical protein VL588_00485 [Bdellovibrionota bacterium]|nr:hypothetical protein [Bdellovibrionota bacterium]
MNRAWFVLLAFGFGGMARAATIAPVSIPFSFDDDSLCFYNADPELTDFGPLGKWGAKNGICQGIAGVASAFHSNAVFEPSAPKPATRKAALGLVSEAIRLHKGECDHQHVRVPGYANLAEFCRDYRHDFLRLAMDYNANIAVLEIFPKLGKFYSRKNGPLKTQSDRRDVKRALDSIYARLARGKAPLLMHYSHVVLVRGMRYEYAAGRISRALLDVYDSNVTAADQASNPTIDEWSYDFDADGLPSMSDEMIWDVTPSRWGPRCHGHAD